MASEVDICNRALQKLGQPRITSLSEQSVAARACLSCYETLRDDLLREHRWNFAISRFQVAADANPPIFGYANSFTLPTGWLSVLPPDPFQNFNDRDWIIEGNALLTNDTAPLNLRCVMRVTDTNLMVVTFREALSSKMAYEMAEQLTQSNTKKTDAAAMFKADIAEAKKANAIERVPQRAPEDTFTTVRA